jgi:hypothetical protein
VHLNRFEIAWGALSYDLPAGAVIALRDSMADTAGMANHMLSVGRTLWKWGGSIGVKSNPFLGVANLDLGDVGHIPWPAWAVELVCKTAWVDLVRMVRLGLATCQRESDLIRMGTAQRERHGLWCRPKKTKKKRKAFCIPLTPVDLRKQACEHAGIVGSRPMTARSSVSDGKRGLQKWCASMNGRLILRRPLIRPSTD